MTKVEMFLDAVKTLEEQRLVVGYYVEAVGRLAEAESVSIGGRLCGEDLRATFAAAVERELVERQYLVARLEESLEERLK